MLPAHATLDPDFATGLGLSDGLVMLGFIGSEQRILELEAWDMQTLTMPQSLRELQEKLL